MCHFKWGSQVTPHVGWGRGTRSGAAGVEMITNMRTSEYVINDAMMLASVLK